MTYCVSMLLDSGLVFLADSRTSAGVDQINTFRKTTVFERPGDRVIVMLASGNLAITQGALNLLAERLASQEAHTVSLHNCPNMFEAARCVGEALRDMHHRDGQALRAQGVEFNASFVVGGQITVNGTVEQHIVAIGGSAVLTRTAVVGGDVLVLGGIIAVGKGADVRGTVTEINSSNVSDAISNLLSDDWEGWSWLFALFSVIIFLTTLVIAMLIVALIPKPIITISEGITLHSYRATIAGFIGLMLIAPIAVLLTLSVIGIVLIPLQIVLVLCAAVFGFIAVAQTMGKRILFLTKKPNDSLIRQTFWGLLILWIIGWIPYVGWMIKVLAIVLGLGGVMITRFGAKKASA
jgi:hypothetical protein